MRDLIELFQERAAIMEYDGKLERSKAEWLAFVEMRRLYGRDLPEEVNAVAAKAMPK